MSELDNKVNEILGVKVETKDMDITSLPMTDDKPLV